MLEITPKVLFIQCFPTSILEGFCIPYADLSTLCSHWKDFKITCGELHKGTVWWFLKNFKTELLYNQTIPLLSTWPKNWKQGLKEICTPMLMATFITVAELEAAQVITDRGLDKQNMVCTDSGAFKIQPLKGRGFWYALQCGWTLRTLC